MGAHKSDELMSRSGLVQPSNREPSSSAMDDLKSRFAEPSGWWSAASARAGPKTIPMVAAAVTKAAMRARKCPVFMSVFRC
jgi:uncharacterized protein (DUF2342 family)